MKIEKLKIYGSMLFLAFALSSQAASITAFAEGEDEILFEDTDDSDYADKLEDITEEEYAEWENSANTTTDSANQTTDSANQTTDSTTQTTGDTIIDLESTEIDEEDQQYNTGRTEIPDYVQTEWERKKGTPEKPENPENPEKPENPENPEKPEKPEETITTEVVTTQDSPIVVIDVPKTGNEIQKALLVGGAAAVVVSLAGSIGYTIYMSNSSIEADRIVATRKKFKRRSKKRNRK